MNFKKTHGNQIFCMSYCKLARKASSGYFQSLWVAKMKNLYGEF